VSDPLVAVESRGDVALLRLARPPANAIDLTLARALDEAVAGALAGHAALVLAGTGACFCAGVDTKAVPAYDDGDKRELIRSINRLVRTLYGCKLPVVAAVTGHAIGGGLIIALTADYRVCTTAPCKLSLSEARAGIPFPAAPLAVMQAELAPQVARVLALRALPIDPAAALASGLVDELAPPEALVERACAVAADMATIPRAAYAMVKQQLRGPALARIAGVVERDDDPLLSAWLTPR
jgi:enoyl-CoA hydratase